MFLRIYREQKKKLKLKTLRIFQLNLQRKSIKVSSIYQIFLIIKNCNGQKKSYRETYTPSDNLCVEKILFKNKFVFFFKINPIRVHSNAIRIKRDNKKVNKS